MLPARQNMAAVSTDSQNWCLPTQDRFNIEPINNHSITNAGGTHEAPPLPEEQLMVAMGLGVTGKGPLLR